MLEEVLALQAPAADGQICEQVGDVDFTYNMDVDAVVASLMRRAVL